MRVAFFATPEFALPSLDALLAAGHEVVLVVSRQDQPAGRHMQLAAPPVVERARTIGLPVEQPEKLGVDQFVFKLRDLRVDVGAVVAFGRLITPRVLRVPRLGMVNVHPSLLPRHRGPTPIETAILSGDAETGVTTMLLDEGFDTGPLLLQRSTSIEARERAWQLERRLAEIGAELLVETLQQLESGVLTATPQEHAAATMTSKLERRMGRIDWSLDAAELARRCRAFDPFPGLYSNFRGARVKVHGLEVAAASGGGAEPGSVVGVSNAGIAVLAGGGSVVLLTELQREGRRRMPADAFILGERVAPGEHFR